MVDGKPTTNESCCCPCVVVPTYASVFVTKGKCGFIGYPDGDNYYTDIVWNPGTSEFDFSGLTDYNTVYRTLAGVFGASSYPGISGSGTGTISVGSTVPLDCGEASITCSGEITGAGPPVTCADVIWDTGRFGYDPRIGSGLGGGEGDEAHVSVEYTDADLQSEADALVAAASYAGDTSAYAIKTTSIDGITIGIRKLKVTFTTTPFAVVEWDDVFTPAGGGSPTTTSHADTADGTGTVVFEIVPVGADADGTWIIANTHCH